MKLNLYPQFTNESVGILLYNILINPDTLVKKINTTEYGFRNVTHERNATHICLHFIEMNKFANGQKYSVDEICGFRYLNNEFRHWIIFRLGKL